MKKISVTKIFEDIYSGLDFIIGLILIHGIWNVIRGLFDKENHE